jgi:hypothetical protein
VVGALAASIWPQIEVLGFVYSILMLALVLFVTGPAALRHFPIKLWPVLWRAVLVPALATLPAVFVQLHRPRFGHPLLDLASDGALFALLCLPGLELARRRFGLALSLRAPRRAGPVS